ncbi:MAG TPA: hypothetical protein VGQ00_04285 [Candidatus Norongarragalinales archaeon]|jgi:hypothetical protein|nr:hypothetical protein [Candidatus Norongarragalinales archaeon]
MNEKIEKIIVIIGLLAAIALSLSAHSLVLKEFMMPTYGNTMVHVATATELINSGYYPWEDYSYGGRIPNLYVPGYRFDLAQLVLLTGFPIDFASRFLVMLFAVLLPLSFFVLGRALFGEKAGVLCAFFASLAPEMLIYTIRPLPQAMGLAILPLALWTLLKNNRAGALVFAITLSLIHQESAVFFAGVAFAYGIAQYAVGKLGVRGDKKSANTALLAWLVCTITYLGWHFAVLGNLNLWDLAQFKYHEGGVVSSEFFFTHTGIVVSWLSIAGGVLLVLGFFASVRSRKEWHEALFLLAAFAVSLFAIKNDVVGLRVFMDRFLVYAQIVLIPLAAFAVLELYKIVSLAIRGELIISPRVFERRQ